MTPEQEGKLFEDIGFIKANISSFSTALVEHTKADAENFKTLDGRLDSIEQKLTTAEAAKAEVLTRAKRKAGLWSAVFSASIAAAFQGVYWFFTRGSN